MKIEVKTKFDLLSEEVRTTCLSIRDLAYSVAAQGERIGPLTETLKWGEPSYLTNATKAGTTL